MKYRRNEFYNIRASAIQIEFIMKKIGYYLTDLLFFSLKRYSFLFAESLTLISVSDLSGVFRKRSLKGKTYGQQQSNDPSCLVAMHSIHHLINTQTLELWLFLQISKVSTQSHRFSHCSKSQTDFKDHAEGTHSLRNLYWKLNILEIVIFCIFFPQILNFTHWV